MTRGIGLDLPAILRAAAEIADTRGMEEVTLATLARQLGIRPPSLYNHVDGLSGLRAKLKLHGLRLLQDALTQAAVGRSGDEAVRALAYAYVDFARAHPGLYTATISAPDREEAELRQTADAIVQLIVRVMQHYELEGDQALHAVRVFRSLLHGFAVLEQTGGFGLPLDINTTLHTLIETALAGIRAMRTHTAGPAAPDSGGAPG